MIKSWTDDAWDDYVYWSEHDKKTERKIIKLIKEIDRNGYKGTGHPEPLKGDLTGYWSRHIDDKNRIVYKIETGVIKIIQCGSHYRDK
ncbi:MAG: Txe/YoeB family addiction module toxin [Lachnospiraceae bacterium]|nr:Txe/YoeB family addiction module toxin [Lachnospiraceae bacterium]